MSVTTPPAPDSNQAPANRVYLEGGILHQKMNGDQTGETIDQLTKDTEEIVERLRAKQEPVLILSDYTDVGEANQESRDKLRNVLGTRYFDRVAVFGLSPTLRIAGQLMLTIAGKKEAVQIFDTEDAAMAWLRGFERN